MSTDSVPARTQDQIVTRMREVVADGDMLGFRREVLLEALDYEHARPYLKPETTEQAWAESVGETPLADRAARYLDFAVGKILDHRGISAGRSVEKLTEYAWLLGRDDVVTAMNRADYAQYGAPKVKAFAVGLALPWPDADTELERMADGDPCEPGCESGCGR